MSFTASPGKRHRLAEGGFTCIWASWGYIRVQGLGFRGEVFRDNGKENGSYHNWVFESGAGTRSSFNFMSGINTPR